MKLSVLMSVYDKESPDFLRQSLDSLAAQTLQAEELVIVEDGPLKKELVTVIDSYRGKLPVVSVRLRAQTGLDAALKAGLDQCRGEFVARMDTDDIAVPDRFACQLKFLEDNPQVDVVGAAIAEFNHFCDAPHAIRMLPESGEALLRFARFRNPLNHMTVVFRRQSVLRAGGYQPCTGFEDYHLWARMLRLGCRLHNLPAVLVYVRCGNGMQRRRGGLSYLRQELAFQIFLYQAGLVAINVCIRNMVVRAPIRLIPTFLRRFCYSRFLRSPVPSRGELNIEQSFES